LADQKIFCHGMTDGVDDGDAVGGAQRNEGRLAVFGDADADRLNGFAPQARNVEADLAGNGALDGIDDLHGAADLGRYP
jgi:hypothetical protein